MKKTLWFVLAAVVFYLAQTAPAFAQWLNQIHPYISVKGEYSDNLDLNKTNKREDFYTTITPGVKFSNMTEKSGIDLNAAVGAVLYDKYSEDNYITGNVNLNAKYLTRSHFNFYLRGSYHRSDELREPQFLTDDIDNKQELAELSRRTPYWRTILEPAVEYQFGPESRIGVRYRYNLYNIKGAFGEDSIENTVNPYLTWWLTRRHGLSLDYAYTNGHFEVSNDFNNHKVSAAYLFRVTPKATASLNGGYSRREYTPSGNDLYYEIYETAVGLTYAFTQQLTVSGQAGYYWLDSRIGQNTNGVNFKGDISHQSAKTLLRLSVQGGYTQDDFTSQNLGFRKYYRATGTVTHFLLQRLSVGIRGSAERVEDENDVVDHIWSAGANVSFMPLRWMTLSAGYTYRQADSDIEINEYKENRGMLTLTLTY